MNESPKLVDKQNWNNCVLEAAVYASMKDPDLPPERTIENKNFQPGGESNA